MANRYWVGGTGTWDSSDTTHWSTTSGGAAGASAPVAADVAIFDINSGSGTVTTSGALSITTFTMTVDSTVGVTLGNSLTISGTASHLANTLNINNQTFICNIFSTSSSSIRTIAFGTSGIINITGSNTTVFTAITATNLTVTGNSQVNLTYSGGTGTRQINGGSTASIAEENTLNFNITAGTDSILLTGSHSFKSVDFTGFSGSLATSTAIRTIFGNLTFSSGMTILPATGPFAFKATSGTKTLTTNGITVDLPFTFDGVGGTWQLQDNCTLGSTRTVTLTNGTLDLKNNTLSCGTFSSSNSNIRSIAFGTGNITCTINNANVFTATTGTNLTYTGTPTVNCTYSGSTGTRVISGPSTDGSAANAFNFNISAGSDTVSFGNTDRTVGNVNFTGFTGSCSEAPKSVYGNLTFVSGMTVASTGTTTFKSTSGTKTITTAGLTLDFPLTFNGIGGTWSFADALTQGSTRTFTITNGTVKLKAGATSTVGAFATNGSNQKYLQSTTAGSQATLSQASGTVNASYLTIKDINATGGATWNAYRSLSNIDAGNNIGWDFLSIPVTTTTLAMRLGFGL